MFIPLKKTRLLSIYKETFKHLDNVKISFYAKLHALVYITHVYDTCYVEMKVTQTRQMMLVCFCALAEINCMLIK